MLTRLTTSTTRLSIITHLSRVVEVLEEAPAEATATAETMANALTRITAQETEMEIHVQRTRTTLAIVEPLTMTTTSLLAVCAVHARDQRHARTIKAEPVAVEAMVAAKKQALEDQQPMRTPIQTQTLEDQQQMTVAIPTQAMADQTILAPTLMES